MKTLLANDKEMLDKQVKIIGQQHPWKGNIGKVIAFDYLPILRKSKYKIRLVDGHECYANLNELELL